MSWHQLTLLCYPTLLLMFLATISLPVSKSLSGNLTICFHTNELNERGTTVAIYDYAHYNEVYLNNTSLFVLPNHNQVTKGISWKRFSKRFTIKLYNTNIKFAMMRVAKLTGCNVLYIMKSGDKNSSPRFSDFACDGPPTAVHGIFTWAPHGTAFAVLTEEQIKGGNGNEWVPHIIEKPERSIVDYAKRKLDYRKLYGISNSTIVICRHGGADSFNVKFVHDAICETMQEFSTDQLRYIFLGTKKFGKCNQPSISNGIIFLEKTSSVVKKEAFFSACDVMVHARSEGEMFSVALGEMSIRNIPILYKLISGAPKQPLYTNNKAILYHNKSDLKLLISNIVINGIDKKKDYNAYQIYSPSFVMDRFRKQFIEKAIQTRKTEIRSPNECVAK